MTNRKTVGMSGASAIGPMDFSTTANSFNDGFDQVSPVPGAPQQLHGLPSSPAVSTTVPTDIAGENGFNMERMGHGAQNIMTDVNKSSGTTAQAHPSFGGADFPVTPQGDTSGKDKYNSADGSRGLNMDDSKASGDY